MASIQELKKTHGERYFKLIAYLGYDDKGKQIRKFKNWTPPKTATGKDMTEKAARELAEKTAYDWEQALLGGECTKKAISLSEIFKIWDKQHLSVNLAPKTVQEHRKRWKRLEPFIGYIKSDKINVQHINSTYAEFQKDGMNLKTGGKLDVTDMHRLLSSMFNWAIKSEYMTKNPCVNATKPKHEKKPKIALDFEQALTLLKNLTKEPLEFQVQISLLISTGIRKGELCGLKWADINSNGILCVSRAMSYTVETGQFEKETKTGSIKYIKLNEHTLKLLNDYRLEQQERITSLGDLYTDNDYLFSQNNGNARHVDGILKKSFKSFLRRCGFNDETIKTVHTHSLRDTFASLMIASGTDVRTVAGLMGHSQPTLTLNTYAQFLPSQLSAAADVFAPLFEQANKIK